MASIKIGIIICEGDRQVGGEEAIGQYFFERFNQFNTNNTINFTVIQALTGSLPTTNEILGYKGFIISGSRSSVNDNLPWIQALENFVKDIANMSEVVRPKLFGICFGHQLIAKALGGRVQKRNGGFIFRAENVVLSRALYDKTFFTDVFGESYNEFKIMQSHGDEVVEIPPYAIPAGSSTSCKYEVLLYGNSIMTTQGHPERCVDDFLKRKIESMLCRKVLTEDDLQKASASWDGLNFDHVTRLVLSFISH